MLLKEYLPITELSQQRFAWAKAKISDKQTKVLDITGLHEPIVYKLSLYGICQKYSSREIWKAYSEWRIWKVSIFCRRNYPCSWFIRLDGLTLSVSMLTIFLYLGMFDLASLADFSNTAIRALTLTERARCLPAWRTMQFGLESW